ncbi:MBL fold metallo-hydrolase [Frigoriflavimonas asaccharolytica]|uniref:Phosphoribosyl 1,2-cyclic phosphate phosphodiesterase n=1 Tax=Frigoriflavimonas asaccharolytica TaxID=2735899 RepID=A0A8J8K5A6_9FLAO|nr:MBL fold metallo-hydrolase [Frigoriflavimonas asaccharolytica]NRS92610.1 phosphoribosyl 1,2-cyclic phosphate phosphodiesterase [Frigoriflavimonas asaccharolytica]
MKLKFLGTGTSQGVPVIGCQCKVCLSIDKKDSRFRASVMISTENEKKILIDCGPDFRQQMLQNHETQVDAVFLTHEHNDHVIGLDDLRPLIFKIKNGKKEMPLFCLQRVGQDVKSRFSYAFADEKYPGVPSFSLHEIVDNFILFETEIIPINVMHGKLPILGFKFKNLAYITDASYISALEKEKLKNLDVLILNCIRKTEPHPSHYILEGIIKINEELKPKTLYLTHISHQFGLHEIEEKLLPKNIHLAFDGLEIKF